MKIVTYNVNGIRAAMSKDFVGWLKTVNADAVCLQEVKAELAQIDVALFHDMGYEVFWQPAEKKGYSGVAILTKIKPKHIEYGCGMDVYDKEGRILRVDYGDFSLMSAYLPSGSSGEDRQAFKMVFLDDFYNYINELTKTLPNLIICGDYNICHKEIDIHNPKSNAKSSGFLPEERLWIEKFIQSGFVDSFRHVNSNPHHYTWWSYRSGARSKNLGWRIDYQMVSKPIADRIVACEILPTAVHSDHCPVLLEIK